MSFVEPWNRTDLKCPPRFTVATQLRPSEVEKVQGMKLVMNEALSSLSGLKVFRKEASLLSRFLYRYKRAFRQEKGVQNLSKIHQAIRRYEKVDLPRVFINFVECIPCNITWTTTESYLPTRQMLKWVLLRILTVAKLMTRIIELSEEAGKYLFGRLRLGWSGHYMIFGIAVTGRIMSCAKFLLLSTISWYRRLYKYITLLIETARFVPTFKFPRKIEDVIGNIDLDPPSRRDNFDTMFELIDLTVEENQEKKPEQEDDVVITNEVIIRSGPSNEGSQEDRQVPVEERTNSNHSDERQVTVEERTNSNHSDERQVTVEERTNSNHSDEEMAVVFERKKIVQPSSSSLSSGASSELAKPIPSISGLSPVLSLPSTSTGVSTSSSSAVVASALHILENSSSDDSDCETQPPETHNPEEMETALICLDRRPRKKNLCRHFKNGRPRK